MNKNKVSLRYSLPNNATEAMKKLVQVLKVPSHKLVGENDKIVLAMSGVILYRHLDRLDKMSVMKMIEALSYPQLVNELRVKCLD